MVVAAHEELRSRGEQRRALAARAAAPRRRRGDRPRPRGAAEETLERARARRAATGPCVERALEVLGARRQRLASTQVAALRSGGKAKESADLQGGGRRGDRRGRRGRRGRDRLRPRGRACCELFGERFAAVKERRGGIDFEDLQLLAAGLLERAEIGGAYRARFRHLMVDEFQDTNRLQVRLIEALRGPATKLMVVGDALQSIYGFRHADLDAFREQRAGDRGRPRRAR